jgi:hypothetical protein
VPILRRIPRTAGPLNRPFSIWVWHLERKNAPTPMVFRVHFGRLLSAWLSAKRPGFGTAFVLCRNRPVERERVTVARSPEFAAAYQLACKLQPRESLDPSVRCTLHVTWLDQDRNLNQVRGTREVT